MLPLQKPLLSLEETLNVTEGDFHQLVALLHCRGLHKVTPACPLPGDPLHPQNPTSRSSPAPEKTHPSLFIT